eukprot:scaffold613_cov243-Pinguiococcus_pyrenoidosus.AAC.23
MALQEKEGIQVEQIRLIYGGRQLANAVAPLTSLLLYSIPNFVVTEPTTTPWSPTTLSPAARFTWFCSCVAATKGKAAEQPRSRAKRNGALQGNTLVAGPSYSSFKQNETHCHSTWSTSASGQVHQLRLAVHILRNALRQSGSSAARRKKGSS